MMNRSVFEFDHALSVLADKHRRKVLRLLQKDNPRLESEFTIDEFVDEVDEPRISAINLYHVHLPKLAEEHIIEWDQESHTVRRGEAFDEIVPFLELFEESMD